jgi:F-box domain
MEDDRSPIGSHGTGKRKRSPTDHTLQAGLRCSDPTREQGGIKDLLAETCPSEVELVNKRARHLNSSSGPKSLAEELTNESEEQCIVSRLSSLPPELLQHTFSFLDPVSLGRLLSVSKLFNALLDPCKPLPPGSGSMRHLSIQDQESIWSMSRKLYHPGFPRPLDGLSESDMWRLVRGPGCQFCGKRSASRIPGQASPWNNGPGPDSIRIVWPFRVRTCSKCLESRLVKVNCLARSSRTSL